MVTKEENKKQEEIPMIEQLGGITKEDAEDLKKLVEAHLDGSDQEDVEDEEEGEY